MMVCMCMDRVSKVVVVVVEDKALTIVKTNSYYFEQYSNGEG